MAVGIDGKKLLCFRQFENHRYSGVKACKPEISVFFESFAQASDNGTESAAVDEAECGAVKNKVIGLLEPFWKFLQQGAAVRCIEASLYPGDTYGFAS